ncbi:MAG: tail fiber protein [Alphaproteobacteria bacterium]|nr:tail fiber protein [Alphaproteobacteria bacterium]
MRKLLTAAVLLLVTSVPSSAAYYGEVAAFAFKFCPKGWTPAHGDEMRVYSHTYMFSLLQRDYGAGRDANSFKLPDLRDPPTLPDESARDRAKLTWCIRTRDAMFPPHPEGRED